MKISTNLFFQRASQQLVSNQDRLDEVQLQLGTGKKINKASDAPEKASTLQRLRTVMAQQESYKGNLDKLTERLQNQDTALQNVSNMLSRLRELSIQYANGTLSADQRRIAAVRVHPQHHAPALATPVQRQHHPRRPRVAAIAGVRPQTELAMPAPHLRRPLLHHLSLIPL